MDPQFSEASGVATFRKRQKRRRSPEQELPLQLPESDTGSSGARGNRQKRGRTNAEKESVPSVERGKIRGEQTGQFCEEESQQRRLRSTVRPNGDTVLNTALDKNSNISVSCGMQQENSCTGKYPLRKRKRSPLPDRNSSLDSASPRTGRNQPRSSEISASPDYAGIVQQMENDENYARSLQAEFDREAEQEQQPVAAEGRRILRSNVSEGPASVTIAGTSTTRSSDHEASEGRPSITIQDSVNEDRASRRMRSASRRRAQSNRRPPSFRHLSDAESFIEEIGLSLPFTNLLSVMHNEADSIFISVQGMHLQGMHINFQNFNDLVRDSLNSDAGLNTRGLSTAQINRLPTRCYCETHTSGPEETFQSSECQICLSTYEEGTVLRTLPCFHEFHTACIDKWLKINRSCPICRALIAVDPDDQ